MSDTIHLQSIGRVNAKRADALRPGDVTIWNFGYTYKVVSVDQVSPKFVLVKMVAEQGDAKAWERRAKIDRLIGVTKG
jgi:hypothetical protein